MNTDIRTAPFGILILRVALGTMFVAHGLTKLLVFTPAGTASFFDSVGFPGWLAWPTIIFELAAGVLLILGIYGRLVAAVSAIELFAASTVHFANGWMFTKPNGGWEYPVFLALVALAIALLGDGGFALRPSSAPAER
jgi:putative oxidoreductase